MAAGFFIRFLPESRVKKLVYFELWDRMENGRTRIKTLI